MRACGVALTKAKYLVTLSRPTVSLFMWISCHETTLLGHINFFQHHILLLQWKVMLRQWSEFMPINVLIGQSSMLQRQKYHHLPSNSCRQVTSGAGRSLPEAALCPCPGPKQSPGFSVQTLKAAGSGFSPSGRVTTCNEERSTGEAL